MSHASKEEAAELEELTRPDWREEPLTRFGEPTTYYRQAADRWICASTHLLSEAITLHVGIVRVAALGNRDSMRRAFRVFDATPDTPGEARAFVRMVLEDYAQIDPAFGAVVDRAGLLATELVTEALAHRPDTVHVLAACLDDRARVEIYDTRRALNLGDEVASESYAIRMSLLSELADRWSIDNIGTGQLNWFELCVAV